MAIEFRVENKIGVLSEVSAIFAKADVFVSTLLQAESQQGLTDLIATTHLMSTYKIQKILPELQNVAANGHSVVIYPVMDEQLSNSV